MQKTILLIYGLPGSGKTTLARAINQRLNCQWFNADEVRSTLSRDLGFSPGDRLEQARRMGCLATLALMHSGENLCIVDFVNPTDETRQAFTDACSLPGVRILTLYMDTMESRVCRFPDTKALFTCNNEDDVVVKTWRDPLEMADALIYRLGLIK